MKVKMSTVKFIHYYIPIGYLYFIQVNFIKVEPFADKDNNRPTKLVSPALVETSDSRDFG